MSLVEVMITLAVVSIATMVASTVLSYGAQQAHTLDLASSSISDQTTFRVEMQNMVESSIPGALWLNPQIAAAFFVPWVGPASPVTTSNGAIGIVQNSLVDTNGNWTSDPTSSFDSYFFIQKSPTLPVLNIADATGVNPSYIISAGQTSQTFNLLGSGQAASYAVNSVVAVDTLIGTQFAVVTATTNNTITLDWSSLGSFSIQAVPQAWPDEYLTSGVSIFGVQVQVLAVDPQYTGVYLWRVDQTTGKYLQEDVLQLVASPINKLKTTPLTAQAQLSNSYLQLHESPFEILLNVSVPAATQQVTIINQPL